MANIILLLSATVIGLFLWLIIFKSEEEFRKKHFLLRLLLLGCLFGVLIIIGKIALDSTHVCSLVTNETLVGVNYNGSDIQDFTFNEYYDTVCFEADPNSTAVSFFKLVTWIIRLFGAYILIYALYEVFMYLRRLLKGIRGRTKNDR